MYYHYFFLFSHLIVNEQAINSNFKQTFDQLILLVFSQNIFFSELSLHTEVQGLPVKRKIRIYLYYLNSIDAYFSLEDPVHKTSNDF